MALRVLFRVDAGSMMGIGHLQRCISLALALGELGAESIFLAPVDEEVGSRLQASGIEHVPTDPLPSGDATDLESTVSTARSRGCDAVVVDAFSPNAAFLADLQDSVSLVAAVDDMAPFPFPCRLVINGSGHAEGLDYRSTNSDTRFLLGTDYALLRPEFRGLSVKFISDKVRRVLVTTGGGDQHGLLPRLIGWLDDVPGDFEVTCVVGPVTRVGEKAQLAADSGRRRVTLVRAPTSLASMMLDADVAVSAGGQTLYELAATGTPTVVVQVADNQVGNIEALGDKGVIRFLGPAREPGLGDKLASAMTELASADGHEARRRMSEAGQALVDGRGAERVAKEIMAMGRVGDNRERQWRPNPPLKLA
jgi:UDP-2,4-diacetamido-2,4,6-trideoxy-beta-L-altropyranose hydrolase